MIFKINNKFKNKTDSFFSRLLTYSVSFGIRYISLVFLLWAILPISIVFFWAYIALTGDTTFPLISYFFETNFPSHPKGNYTLSTNEMVPVFAQFVLVVQIFLEIINFILRKNKKSPRYKNKDKYNLLSKVKIFTLLYFIAGFCIVIGNNMGSIDMTGIALFTICYVATSVFLMIYSLFDYASNNIEVS